ncbi:ABC transporter ATP-binding protein [Geobacter sp. AOG1]|uniref:ABC transporter ATP-binding protein n=1 Tax=Geobacter sp. AOG1 TaxID=1566346 RepID=UPI001CC6F81F|nr:ABC transporter ATP-binding protein [Geobacter sp. AOG1]GFE56321.1 ABC transporter ATP-binding protein [Geobacter sp. AOG1]
MSAVLETRGLWKSFGGLMVTKDVNLSLSRGARHALIGPNGAGKTTLINQLTGVLRPSDGSVWLEGADITHIPSNERVWRGLSRTFQINTLFPRLTPLEAVTNAICVREHSRLNLFKRRFSRLSRRTAEIDEAHALLENLNLAKDCLVETHKLAYGKQRLLEMALALATRPKVLLLDEPAAGVPEGESDELFEVLAALPSDISILLIEHDMNLVFNFAKTITVLVGGAELMTGTPAEIANDPRVREVYLGKGHGDAHS